MNNHPVGYTDKYRITIRKAGALYDPETVQVLFLKGDGSLTTLTLGGAGEQDDQLTRVSAGVYEWWYKYDIAGHWMVTEQWLDQGGDATVINDILHLNIYANPFVAPTP